MPEAARHWIGGNWVRAGDEGRTRAVYSGVDFGTYFMGGIGEAEASIAEARRGFDRSLWSHTPRLRAAALHEFAEAITARRDQIAHAIALESGKVMAHCRHETDSAISEAQYYAGLARAIFGRVAEIEEGKQSILSREALGVVSIIVPWNAPSTLLVRALGPALAAGCAVVIKGAHQTSTVNAIYSECLASCPSLPPGIVNVVHGDLDVAQILCTHPDVDGVCFTGSSATGKKIMAGAAPTLKRLSLELGGKSPALVFADANMALAAREIVNGLIAHCGQMCTAVGRVLVQREAWDAFVPLLVDAARTVTVGDPLDDTVRMGPLFDPPAVGRWAANVAAAAQAGETLLAGELQVGHPQGNVVTPGLYAIQDTGHPLVQEELFAPIGIVEPFETEEEAVVRANGTRYGLAASVHTTDGARGRRVARALKSGTVWINCHNRLFAEAETGGYRESGLGRLHGLEGLSDFMETKHIYAEFGRLPGG